MLLEVEGESRKWWRFHRGQRYLPPGLCDKVRRTMEGGFQGRGASVQDFEGGSSAKNSAQSGATRHGCSQVEERSVGRRLWRIGKARVWGQWCAGGLGHSVRTGVQGEAGRPSGSTERQWTGAPWPRASGGRWCCQMAGVGRRRTLSWGCESIFSHSFLIFVVCYIF